MEEDYAHVEQTWYKIGTAALVRAVPRRFEADLYSLVC